MKWFRKTQGYLVDDNKKSERLEVYNRSLKDIRDIIANFEEMPRSQYTDLRNALRRIETLINKKIVKWERMGA
jgi:uncharacterized protein YpbB